MVSSSDICCANCGESYAWGLEDVQQ
jgi:hypothetical protein